MQSYEEKLELPTELIHFYVFFKKKLQNILVIQKKAVTLHPQISKRA